MAVAFHNPKSIGVINLGATQINKPITFTTPVGVFLASSKVRVFCSQRTIKTLTIGNGLSIVGDNINGSEKTLTCLLNGDDYRRYKGDRLSGECTFFIEGDIEIVFYLNII